MCRVSQEDEVEEDCIDCDCVRTGENTLSTIFRAKDAPVPKLNPSIILPKKDGVEDDTEEDGTYDDVEEDDVEEDDGIEEEDGLGGGGIEDGFLREKTGRKFEDGGGATRKDELEDDEKEALPFAILQYI